MLERVLRLTASIKPLILTVLASGDYLGAFSLGDNKINNKIPQTDELY